ncbi:hypothetical protein M9Y10_002538 [Tritrichomonas musculus]|uniref:RING-type domain-containing protein n=1 Tax=Tritrichomonas musculus TaxID=1915356 RepID=A0ABR2LCI5_9EUKA
MRHTHENFDLNSDLKLFSKHSSIDKSPTIFFSSYDNQIQSQPSESDALPNDYLQDDFCFFDLNTNLPEDNNDVLSQPQCETKENLELYPHDYTQEIDDFVNRAANLYSEENISYLKKELNNKGLVLSFQPPPFNCWQCVICSDNAKSPIVFPCGHIFCKQCINEWSKHSNFCPICHTELDKDNAIEIRSFLDGSPRKK